MLHIVPRRAEHIITAPFFPDRDHTHQRFGMHAVWQSIDHVHATSDDESLLLLVVVLTLTRIIKSVVTGEAPVTLELRNNPGKNTNNPRWYTHISQLTQFMPYE